MCGPDAPWIFCEWQLKNGVGCCRQHDLTRRIQKLSGSDRRRVTQSRRVKHSVENKQACLTVKQATSHKRTKTNLHFSAFGYKNGQCQRHRPSVFSTPGSSESAGLYRRETAEIGVPFQCSAIAHQCAGGHAGQLRRIELFDDIGQEQNGLRWLANFRRN